MVVLIRVLPGVCRVYSGSLDSIGCVLVVVGFIRCCWGKSGAPLASSGALGVVGFNWVRHGGR